MCKHNFFTLKLVETMSISKAQVPTYLIDSDFFMSLSSDEGEVFSIPERNLKPTPNISSAEDLSDLLHTIRFWGVHRLPEELLEFIVRCNDLIDRTQVREVFLEFDSDLKLHQLYNDMQAASTSKQRLQVAAKGKRVELLEHVLRRDSSLNMTSLKTIAESGFANVLRTATEQLRKSNPRPLKDISAKKIAALGHVDCVQFLFENGFAKDLGVCVAAAENGHLDCVLQVHEMGCPWDSKVTTAAASHGHLPCLTGLQEAGCPMGMDAACGAAQNGHLDCLTYVLDRVELGRAGKKLCNLAATSGHLHCLKYLHERDCGWDFQCSKAAARHGHAACLRYACEQGCCVDHTAGDAAAEWGHVECVEYLLSLPQADSVVRSSAVHCCVQNSLTLMTFMPLPEQLDMRHRCLRLMQQAGVTIADHYWFGALNEHNDRCLRILGDARFAVPPGVLEAAMNRSALKCFEVLCSLPTVTLRVGDAVFAAERGLCTFLKALKKFGCPMDVSVCAAAARGGLLKCLQYLRETLHCPWDVVTCVQAARHRDADVLRYAREAGCPWDETVSRAAVHSKSKSCLRYCVEHGCPMDAAVMDEYNKNKVST